MPRRPRLITPGIPLHIIQRGNNRQPCFFADEDYQYYLEWLRDYSRDSGCSIHAYVLMTNHVHLLLTPDGADSAGSLMKRLGQRYVQYVTSPINAVEHFGKAVIVPAYRKKNLISWSVNGTSNSILFEHPWWSIPRNTAGPVIVRACPGRE